MLPDDLTLLFLKGQRSLFQSWVHLTIDKDACVEIVLRQLAENLVFAHDLLVKLVDALKVLFGRFFVAEDLIVH